ncbi:Calx-beta domain-containing protein [Kordia periserrulae]|nr:Calx-beta domain-containing protein [Kordia periserrulae]
MKSIKLYMVFFCILIIFSCNEDDEDFSGTGTANFSITSLQEVENATSALAINIGIDNFNHAGGTISVAISGATYGTDYETSAGSDTFTLDVAQGGLITSFSIQPIDNDAIEANKQLTITLTDATGALTIGDNATLTFTILEDDDPLVAAVAFESATLAIQENATSATTINIPFDQETTNGGTITIETTGDAVLGTDYTIVGQTATTFTLTVPANATTASFDIQAIDNTVFEADKSIIFTVTEVSGGLSIGTIPQLTVSIENDDSPPNPLIDFDASNTTSYNEDAGTITVNFTLSGTTTAAATIQLTTSGTTDASDFNFGGSTANPYSFTIPAGSSTGSVAITITDDATVEMDEILTLEITNVSGGLDAGVNLQQQTITITDNDAVAFNYVEDFESGTDLATLGFENILNGQTVDPTRVISLITSNGNFSDVNNVNGTSDNGLNMFYNAGSGTTVTELLDNVLVSPIMNASGNMEVIIDNSYAFLNQNSATVTYYWSQTYNGSGTFIASEWNVMGTETAANMNGEGFGNNTYKQQQFNISPTGNFYIAIRVSQTIDGANYRTRWRFDNLKVNSL